MFLQKLKILVTLTSLLTFIQVSSQNIDAFKENAKWGFKQSGAIIISPQYDTIFGFDQTNRICLVGQIDPSKKSINPLTKEVKLFVTYFYINPKNEKIYIKRSDLDSTADVQVDRYIMDYYLGNNNAFVALVNSKKYLVDKAGITLQKSACDQISFTSTSNFYLLETKDSKSGQTLVGLMNGNGEYVIQSAYSKISLNADDSLIYCCTAGIRFNGSDDVYNYKGEKIHSSAKHIQFASKKHVIYKLFDSENAFIIFDMETGQERSLHASQVYYLKNEKLAILDKDWYFYDMNLDKRMAFDKKLIKYYNLND